jgi:hypothetical protein
MLSLPAHLFVRFVFFPFSRLYLNLCLSAHVCVGWGGGGCAFVCACTCFRKKFKNKYYYLHSKLVDILDRGRWPTIGTPFMSKTSNKKDRMEYILINRGSTITTSSLIHKTYQINDNTEDKLMSRWPKFTVNTMWFFIYLFVIVVSCCFSHMRFSRR